VSREERIDDASGQLTIKPSNSFVDDVGVKVGTQTSAEANDTEEGYDASSASSNADVFTGELQELGGTNEFISSQGLAYNPGQTEAKQVGIKRTGDYPAVGGAILVGEWEIVQDSNGNLVAKHGPSNAETTLATS